jgi:hypothetical protein
MPPFKGEHLEQARAKLVGTYLLQGQALRFPHPWLKTFGSPKYAHYDWVDHTW